MDNWLTTVLEHPGVKHSHCEGAIGILAVKRTVDGVFLYFGHNTESFVSACLSLVNICETNHCRQLLP